MIIVWYKKDLRLHDHAPLFEASNSNQEVLHLYVFEPEMWCQEDYSLRHFYFLKDCIKDLSSELIRVKKTLVVKIGPIIDVLASIDQIKSISKVVSYQETGNNWSYNRDKKIKRWFESKKIKWLEFPNNGIQRGLKNRDHWSENWYKRMTTEKIENHFNYSSFNIDSTSLEVAEKYV
ncbi:deoxyribodipyrimidine photolyase, partial [Candidatus Marinamargulisbacteria bacterium SCGC AG-410-N11]